MSIYTEATAKCETVTEIFCWEASRCTEWWKSEEPYVAHRCGLSPGHNGKCVCRHCGESGPREDDGA